MRSSETAYPDNEEVKERDSGPRLAVQDAESSGTSGTGDNWMIDGGCHPMRRHWSSLACLD